MFDIAEQSLSIRIAPSVEAIQSSTRAECRIS